MRVGIEVFQQRDFSQCCHRYSLGCQGNSDFFQRHIPSARISCPVHNAVGTWRTTKNRVSELFARNQCFLPHGCHESFFARHNFHFLSATGGSVHIYRRFLIRFCEIFMFLCLTHTNSEITLCLSRFGREMRQKTEKHSAFAWFDAPLTVPDHVQVPKVPEIFHCCCWSTFQPSKLSNAPKNIKFNS